MQSVSQKVVVNTGYLYLRLGISMFITLWTTRLILNSLGVSDFGLFNTIGGAIGMLGFINASMAGSTQRYMSYFQGAGNIEKCTEIFNVSIVIHLVLSVILIIILSIAGLFFFHGILNIPADRTNAAIIVYCALIVSTAFTVITVPYDAIVNSHENMGYYAAVGIILSIIKLVIAFVVVFTSSDKLIVYGILMSMVAFIGWLIMKMYCHRSYGECIFSPHRYWSQTTAKEMTQFAGWNFYRSITSFIGNYGTVLIMNHFFGVIMNAAAGIASQIGGQLQTFSNSMQRALDPAITKSEGKGERNKMIEITMSGCKFTFATFAFFAIPFLVETPFLLKLWLKNVPENSIIFSRLIIAWTLIYILSRPLEQSILSEGHISGYSRVSSVINMIPVFLLIILYSIGFPPVTMYYVNIFFLAICISLVRLYYVHKIIKLSYFAFIKRVFFPILISFSLAFFLTYIPNLLMKEGTSRLLMTVLVGFISYITAFWYLSTNDNEKMVLCTFLNNLKFRFGFSKK